jgi:hypothetical protein
LPRTTFPKTPPARRARERGNTMLESALIIVPMLAIFLGIIDVSLVVFIQSTLNSATREGTRFAITYSSSYNGNSCATSEAACIAQVVQYNAVGLPSGLASNYITVNYFVANNLTTPVMSCSNGTCTTNSICGPSFNAGCTNGSLNITISNTTYSANGTATTTNQVVNYVNAPGNVVQVAVNAYPWNWLVPMPGIMAGTGVTMNAQSVDVLGALAPGTSVPPSP